MYLLNFLLLLLLILKSQRVFTNENINELNCFSAKTNTDLLYSNYLNKNLLPSFTNEINSNHIEKEGEERKEISNYKHKILLNSNSNITETTTTTTTAQSFFSNSYKNFIENNNNRFSSFKKHMTLTNQSSSEESNESETKAHKNFKEESSNNFSHFKVATDSSVKETEALNSSVLTLNRTRIPPPSIMDSATTRSSLRVCEIKYAEYIERIFPQESDTASDATDAELNGRILAAPGEYPHMTAIGFRSYNGQMDYKCGGSLISESFVITAAHCTNFTGLSPSRVRIGDLNLMIEESFLEPQLRDIKNIFVHPNYTKNSYYNDIALLELEKEVHLTEFVRPIRLWTKESLPFNLAYAMGYGSTGFAKEHTNRLTNLNMTIVPNDQCNREMPQMPQTARGILLSQICAKDYVLNRDTCQGDSGGPLQLNVKGQRRQSRIHYHLIGITSYGLYCRSGYPSIYTRVYSYLDWIEHIVWRDYFK